ncbi:MAG: hypothetical protein JWN48_3066 [Myxococcaceae bacterium]|nr:hypothetical protein [Myxococcaceae bacterium]
MLQTFPLLALTLIIYVVVSLLQGAVPAGGLAWYDLPSFELKLISGDLWAITAGDLFLGLSMVMLFIEILRATRSGSSSVLNHALSVVVFVVGLLLFITVKGFGNSVFFLFLSMTFLDFMAGFIITTMTARRDFAFGRSE